MNEAPNTTPETVQTRNAALTALELSEMRYRRLFETARDGILILEHPSGRIADSNPYMTEILGYTHDDLIGKELWQIGLFEDEAASRAAVETLQASGYIRYDNLPLQSLEGIRREVEFVSNVYTEGDGTVIQCNIRDITDRKHVEAELRAIHEKLQIAYERERRITEALQRPLTVPAAENAFPGFSLATFYESALSEAEVGGDFFDAFAAPDGRVALVLADTSGKGLAAAVRAFQVKDVLRAFTRETPDSPSRIVTRLNDFVRDTHEFDEQSGESFTCLTLAIIDSATGKGAIVSAGCEPPLIVRAGGAAEVIECAGMPLGIEYGEAYPETPLSLNPGDTLVLVTDGITEARHQHEFLGYEGMIKLAQRSLAAIDGQVPSVLESAQTILESARAFGGGDLRDDACLLLARRT